MMLFFVVFFSGAGLYDINHRGHLKTYTVISFHNLYHQPPQLIPISIHNLYHFEGSASTSTTYTINWHQSGITYTIPEISIAELIPILID